jgi:hypothetical protein
LAKRQLQHFLMLRKILTSLGGGAGAAPARPSASPIEEVLLRQIVEARAQDPTIGARVASKEILRRLGNMLATETGVHAESLFCALGALAGYACQTAVRTQATARGLPAAALLAAAQGEDGHTYYRSGSVDAMLAESQNAVWSLLMDGARQAGFETLPDVGELFHHVASSIGTPDFGKPRQRGPRAPRDLPYLYLRSQWPAFQPMVMKFCSAPDQWPLAYAYAIQEALQRYRQQFEPGAAAALAMECAIAMSRIDFSTHGQASTPLQSRSKAATLATP